MIQIELAERLGEVKEYYFSKKLAEIEQLKAQGKDIISLGIGSPDLPPHSSVVEALHTAAQNPKNHGYANYKGTNELLAEVAAWYQRKYGVELNPKTEVLSLYGSKEALLYITNTYINKGDKVLVPNPGYPAYSSAVRLVEGEMVSYELSKENGWLPVIEELPTEGIKMMLMNYPHMPTGASANMEFFEKIVAWAKEHNILLVHDNPYSFMRNDNPISLLSVEGAKDIAVELNSLSKSHNMAGWRLGFLVGCEKILADVLRYKSNLNNSMFLAMQEASVVALQLGDEWYKSQNELYRSREKLGAKIFDALGCKYQEGQVGLFLWAELPEDYEGDCYSFCDDILYGKDVFLTPGGIFGSAATRYVRLSLCADAIQLQRVLDRLTVK